MVILAIQLYTQQLLNTIIRGDNLKVYALYKGEELLAIGTADELANQRGVKRRTIYKYTEKAYQHHPRKNGESKRIIAIKLDD